MKKKKKKNAFVGWVPFWQQQDKELFDAETGALIGLWPRVKNNLYEVLLMSTDMKGQRLTELNVKHVSVQAWNENRDEALKAGWKIDPRWGNPSNNGLILIRFPDYKPEGESCISQCAPDSAVGKLDPISKRRIGDGEMLWLSIKQNNQGVMNDWRVLQRIKNEVCGLDMEAVQLYPAMSRLTDCANQFHLFVLPKWDCVGWQGPTAVEDTDAAVAVGSKQRQLPSWMKEFETSDALDPSIVTGHYLETIQKAKLKVGAEESL